MTSYNDSFLNLLKYPLDKYQNEALKTVDNAVIAAGAGSGKTQVLATRFAWLIMTNQAKVDEILTLTYTNKAAAEMYQRIYETLYKFANTPLGPNLTEEHQKLAKQALEDFANAHIQTLDSYCASIVRQCANRYGIKPDFATGSSDSERIVKDSAFTFILQNSSNLAVQTFVAPGKLQDFAENTFANIILNYTSLTTKDNYFESSLTAQVEAIADAWNNMVAGKSKEPGALRNLVETIEDTYTASKKIQSGKYEAYDKQIRKLLEEVHAFYGKFLTPQDIISKSPALDDAINCYYHLEETILFTTSMNGKCTEISKTITPLKNQLEFYKSIISFIVNYSSIQSLFKLLDEFLVQTNTSKRNSGNLSFRDISDLTLKILLENEDIRNQEKNAYSKIMIDEFQDNNGKNRDLLYILSLRPGEFENNGKCKIEIPEGQTLHNLLVEKRSPQKLFFVGDEKQSIYKFRGAEVSVFNELTQNNENKLIPMSINYRSTPQMVKAFNVLFKNGNGIFNQYQKPEEKIDYEAYYDKLAEKNGIELPELTPQNIPIHALCLDTATVPDSSENYLPKKDQLAYEMAKRIYNMGVQDKNWSDFAILDKSRTDREIFTKYLNLFGIPYTVDQQKNIFQDGVINDFYNFLRLCVYPSDQNALAAYLCSPMCGVSLEAMEVILLNQDEKQIKDSISPADFEKYTNGIKFFDENRKLVLQQKLTTTLSMLWNNKGYKYETMLNEQLQLNAEHFDILFELAREAEENQKTVSWFIDQLDILKSSYKNNPDLDISDITYPIERSQAVNIMTIHKSKGLEFEHVFLYGCTDQVTPSEKGFCFFDPEYQVTIKPDTAPNYFVLLHKDLAAKKEAAEFIRLIYVGITRAIKDCFIMCSYSSSTATTSQFKIFETMLLRFTPNEDGTFPFIPEMGFDYIPIKPVLYTEIERPASTNTDNLRQSIIDKAKAHYQNAKIIEYESHPVNRSTPSALEKEFSGQFEQQETVLTSRNFSAADFGTLVHSYLEQQALGIQPEKYIPDVKLLKNLSDSPEELKETLTTCIQMCTIFANSDLGKAFFAAKNEGLFFRAEWAFRMFVDDTIFTGSIDLIFQNEDGSYTIVDYKSDNTIDAEKYVEQQKCYRTAASKLLHIPEENIQLHLFFLKHNVDVQL